jgi:hypothetical protein
VLYILLQYNEKGKNMNNLKITIEGDNNDKIIIANFIVEQLKQQSFHNVSLVTDKDIAIVPMYIPDIKDDSGFRKKFKELPIKVVPK